MPTTDEQRGQQEATLNARHDQFIKACLKHANDIVHFPEDHPVTQRRKGDCESNWNNWGKKKGFGQECDIQRIDWEKSEANNGCYHK